MFTSLFTIFAATCQKASFFGLIPWYQFLKLNDKCDIAQFNVLPTSGSKTDVPLVLAAIVDDLLRIAGIVAVAFVIVGAVQLITSQGEPEGTAKARDTITNALIGMVIAMVGVAFVGYVGNRLGG